MSNLPKSENLTISGQLVQMTAEDKGKNGQSFFIVKVKLAQDASYHHNGQNVQKINGVELQFAGRNADKVAQNFRWEGNRFAFDSKFQMNSMVTVTFKIEGKTYMKKDGSGKGFFQNLNAWKMEYFNVTQPQQPQQQTAMQPAVTTNTPPPPPANPNWNNQNTTTATQVAPAPDITQIEDDVLPF